MSELGVYSDGKPFMDMMPRQRRRNPIRLAIVGQNCSAAAVVVDPERTVKGKPRKRGKRSQNTGIHRNKSMHLKPLKKELKVLFYRSICSNIIYCECLHETVM